MPENKTKPTGASVEDYLDARASGQQRADCDQLMALLQRVTGEQPAMWGPSIVGFGAYRYTYDSGRTGEAPLTGFAVRGRDLVVYLLPRTEEQRSLLSRLGRHRMGTSCLYFRRLEDLDPDVFERLLTVSVDEVRRRYA